MNILTPDQVAALLDATKIKPRIKKSIRFTPEEITDWGDRDFIVLLDRNRTEGVMIVPLGRGLSAASFRLQRRKPNATGKIEAVICDICATWRRGTESAVISFWRGKSTVSFLCCADLLCSLHVRDKTAAATLSRTQLRESISVEGRIARLKTRLYKMINDNANQTS
jgi:hypothetical protein